MTAKFASAGSMALLAALLFLLKFHASSQGSAMTAPPTPTNLPLPDGVVHSDAFGHAMAFDGDVLVVGAPYTKVGANSSQGQAYIYTRNAGSAVDFTFVKAITGSATSTNSYFGWSVAVYSDTIVVGAHNALEALGAVHIFQRNQGGDNNWGEVKRIGRPDNRKFTDFGRTVALHGDTLVVAAPLGYGEVQLFQRHQGGDNNWGAIQTLTAGYTVTPTGAVANFGDTLAFDGVTLAIGATRDSVAQDDLPPGAPAVTGNYPGSVYVFRQEQGQWVREAKLVSSDIDQAASWYGLAYGTSLALNGDLLLVGERSGKVNGVQVGKVHLYQRGVGTPPPVGKPGAWGQLATLTPTDGVAGDLFGQALYAVADGAFVGSKKQGIGRVYFFRNPPAVLAGAAQQTLSWRQVYSFTTGAGAATTFGIPLAGGGDAILMGESTANSGRGGILAYARSALFAYDPAVTPTPTPTPSPTVTPTPPPVEPASCLDAQRLFLPLVAGGASTTAATSAPHTGMAGTVVATLAPGCVVAGPGGVKIGAVAGAISETLTISLSITTAPTFTLPAGANVLGDYLHIAAARNRLTAIESPFVIAVPAPAGADVAHLVLLHTLAPELSLDRHTTDAQWSYLPGVYDAANNHFLARLPFMLSAGSTFVLAAHPDFASPANPSAPPTVQGAAGEQTAASSFTAHCVTDTFAEPSDCNTFHEHLVSQMATEIYLRMTETFGYPKILRLLDAGGQFIVNETASIYLQQANYALYILSREDAQCGGDLGFYRIATGFLALCMRPGDPIDQAEKETLIHEMFHAFQHSYPIVLQQWEDGDAQPWAVEGMAEAAVNSYPETIMKRSGYYGVTNLKDVDQALTAGRTNDGNIEEYLAQDFWVYVGARHGDGLEYLHGILATGGVNQREYSFAFGTIFHEPFHENYWGWVKHQAIENIYDVGVGTGETCMFSADALIATRPEEFLASRTYFPYDTGAAFDVLPPLTARVIEIKFGAKTHAIVTTGYRDCVGIQDEPAFAACKHAAQASLRVKIYEEGEPLCWNEVLPGVSEEGVRMLSNISEFKRYFVVVANVTTDEDEAYYLAVE
ncbi:MAG TPA: hypothetical protein GYA08_21800 [Chloroflexi bacterium]|nr:hypothetical protein [Chloroflexota bacterium]